MPIHPVGETPFKSNANTSSAFFRVFRGQIFLFGFHALQ
jgi:hypothetical protein